MVRENYDSRFDSIAGAMHAVLPGWATFLMARERTWTDVWRGEKRLMRTCMYVHTETRRVSYRGHG